MKTLELLHTKMTPDAAERLVLVEMLAGRAAPAQVVKTAESSKWPALGEEVFVTNDIFGGKHNKRLTFVGLMSYPLEGKNRVVGNFTSDNNDDSIVYYVDANNWKR